jgi:hypothetical protein
MTLRQQNIQTYPTLNIAQCPGLMAKMGTNAGAAVEIWNPRTKAWVVEDVDHCMNIKSVPQLLIHFLGVTDCSGFSSIIREDKNMHIINKGKRHLDNDSEPDSLSLHHAVSMQPLTQGSNSSPITTYSPLSSFPPSPVFSDFNLPLDVEMRDTSPATSGSDLSHCHNGMADYDALWAEGYVHVPEGKTWPDGMYARDMAWGFTQLRMEKRDIKAHFSVIFPGTKWVRATYYRQLDAFIGSTTNEIDECRKLGETDGIT